MEVAGHPPTLLMYTLYHVVILCRPFCKSTMLLYSVHTLLIACLFVLEEGSLLCYSFGGFLNFLEGVSPSLIQGSKVRGFLHPLRQNLWYWTI